MRFGKDEVVRDNTLSVHPDFHPHDAFVRIMNKGSVTGTGWFRFTDTEAECEKLERRRRADFAALPDPATDAGFRRSCGPGRRMAGGDVPL